MTERTYIHRRLCFRLFHQKHCFTKKTLSDCDKLKLAGSDSIAFHQTFFPMFSSPYRRINVYSFEYNFRTQNTKYTHMTKWVLKQRRIRRRRTAMYQVKCSRYMYVAVKLSLYIVFCFEQHAVFPNTFSPEHELNINDNCD